MKRVERKRREVRRKLLAAGYEAVGRDGLRGFTMTSLAKSADCSIGAVYTHFETPAVFVDNLIDAAYAPLSAAVDRRMESGERPDHVLAAILSFILNRSRRDQPWAAFRWETRSTRRAFQMGEGARIEKLIRRGRREGLFDMENAIGGLVFASAPMFLQRRQLEEAYPNDAAVTEAIERMFAGLGAEPGQTKAALDARALQVEEAEFEAAGAQ